MIAVSGPSAPESPSIDSPMLSGVFLIQKERGGTTSNRTSPMAVEVNCHPQTDIERASTGTSTAGRLESIAWNDDMASALRL